MLSQASVDAYNAKLDSMRVRITKYNASLEIAKMEQFAHNIGVQAYNRQCTKKYYQDDMDSAKKKLGLKDEAPGLR